MEECNNCHGNDTGAHRKTFSLAKHRADSTQRPLAAWVMDLEGLIRTACRITIARKGTSEADDASQFLHDICENGWQRVIQMGMLADAGQESIELKNAVDDEAADTA